MFRDGPEYYELMAKLCERCDSHRNLSIDDLNEALPSDFPLDELDEVFEDLRRKRVTVVDVRENPSAPARSSVEMTEKTPKAPSRIAEAANESSAAASSAMAADTSPAALVSGTREEIEDLSSQEQMELLANPSKQYFSGLSKLHRLDEDEERQVAERASSGDEEARQALIRAYMPLVAKIAKRYKRSAVPFMELVLAGNEGLVEAARHYVPGSKRSFASTARWWIGHHLSRCVAENWKASRIPQREARKLRKMARIVARYRVKRGRMPSAAFLARAMRIPLDEVFFLKGLFESPLSLQAPFGDDADGALLSDLIADANAREGCDSVEKRAMKERMRSLLQELELIERRVLILRYGIEDEVARSFEEVARLTGMSRREVVDYERRGLEKLRGLG